MSSFLWISVIVKCGSIILFHETFCSTHLKIRWIHNLQLASKLKARKSLFQATLC